MTRLQLPLIGAFALLLASCTSYHYVAPLPAVPQFEAAGEVQGQLALSATHGEIQFSASPIKHVGFTYNGFRSFNSDSRMNSFTLHNYWKMGRMPVFLTGSLGYDKGNMESKKATTPSSMPYEDYFHSSAYRTYRLGMGIYGYIRNEEHRQVSLDVHLQQIDFSRLSTRHQSYSSTQAWDEIRLRQPSSYRVISPMLTFTLIGSRKGLFYYRQTLGANIPIGPRLPVERTYWDQPQNSAKIYTYTDPIMSMLVISGTVGMRLNAFDLFRK